MIADLAAFKIDRFEKRRLSLENFPEIAIRLDFFGPDVQALDGRVLRYSDGMDMDGQRKKRIIQLSGLDHESGFPGGIFHGREHRPAADSENCLQGLFHGGRNRERLTFELYQKWDTIPIYPIS